MTWYESIFLGILQGVTEFLPVSSSGHLTLFQRIFGIGGDLLFFDIAVHVGTLIAVCVVFYKDIFELIKHPFGKDMRFLLVATLPTVLIFFLFEQFFRESFQGTYLGFGFLVTAVLLLVSDRVCAKKTALPLKPMTYPSAIAMGVAQGLAIMPGISRSGSTVCTALLMGTERKTAAKFSFLMSIPIILGSTALESYHAITDGALSVGILPIILGVLFAAVSGYFSIRFMLKLLSSARLYGFSIYLFLLSAFTLLNHFVLHLF